MLLVHPSSSSKAESSEIGEMVDKKRLHGGPPHQYDDSSPRGGPDSMESPYRGGPPYGYRGGGYPPYHGAPYMHNGPPPPHYTAGPGGRHHHHGGPLHDGPSAQGHFGPQQGSSPPHPLHDGAKGAPPLTHSGSMEGREKGSVGRGARGAASGGGDSPPRGGPPPHSGGAYPGWGAGPHYPPGSHYVPPPAHGYGGGYGPPHGHWGGAYYQPQGGYGPPPGYPPYPMQQAQHGSSPRSGTVGPHFKAASTQNNRGSKDHGPSPRKGDSANGLKGSPTKSPHPPKPSGTTSAMDIDDGYDVVVTEKVEPMRTDFHLYTLDHMHIHKKAAEKQVLESIPESKKPKSGETVDPYILMTNLNARLMSAWELETPEKRAFFLKREEEDRKRFMNEEEVASRHCATLTARAKSPKPAGTGSKSPLRAATKSGIVDSPSRVSLTSKDVLVEKMESALKHAEGTSSEDMSKTDGAQSQKEADSSESTKKAGGEHGKKDPTLNDQKEKLTVQEENDENTESTMKRSAPGDNSGNNDDAEKATSPAKKTRGS